MNYPTKKLGEVLELKYGKAIDRTDRSSDGKYPVYGANGVLDYSNKYLVDSEAIIVGRKGSAGEITQVSGKFWPSDVTYYVLGNKNVDIDYAFYLLKSLNLQKLAVGVKPGINRNRVYEIEVQIPPFSEQKKVVAKLEKLLAKIKEAKKLRAESQEAAQNLFPAAVHKIFPEGKKKGWEEKILENVVKIKRENNKKFLPYVGMENVESGTGRFIGLLEPKEVLSNTFYFDNHCVLYGRLRPYLNKVLMPDFEGHCSTEMFPLVPDQAILTREYLWYWITQQSFIDQAMKTAMGARMPRANMKEVMKFKILLPPLSEQKKIVAYLDSLSGKVQSLQKAQAETAKDFTDLEQSILHQAFSGKLIL